MTKFLGLGAPKVDMPTPQAPPPVPQIDQGMIKAQQDQAMMRSRGAATTILTSDNGLPNLGSTSKPKAYGAR
jgi:hypothetical protein